LPTQEISCIVTILFIEKYLLVSCHIVEPESRKGYNQKETVFQDQRGNAMQFQQTENEHVILRPLALPDADHLRDLFDHPLSLPKTREMIQALLDSDKTVLAVIDPKEKTPRGLVEISGDDGQTVTIGYRIRTPYRNMHYGSEAVYLLCRCLCGKHGIKRIKALVKKDNERSLRLLRHCGFEKTGETGNEEQYEYYSQGTSSEISE